MNRLDTPRVHFRLIALLACLAVSATARAQALSSWESSLEAGKPTAAAAILEKSLVENPKDDNTRLALGVVRFLDAVQKRAQGFHRHGLRTGGMIGLTNLPIPNNPQPEKFDAKQFRAMLVGWVDDLEKVDRGLAEIKSAEVKVPFRFGRIGLDLDGDGKSEPTESLASIYRRFNDRSRFTDEGLSKLVVAFDRADVDWLRGYCHLLSSLAEIMLAHDFTDLFNHSAYLLFDGAVPPYAFLKRTRESDIGEILDLVAMIHVFRLPVAEPGHLKSSLNHLEQVTALSRSTWRLILAETDNDREWIPNPKQTSADGRMSVTAEMVEGWHLFLDEFESILAGKKLLPFWRGGDNRVGINARRVLLEPRTLDLVLWVQGTAAAPYLEKGEVTNPATWERINRMFRGEFIGFAIWFN